MASKQKDFPRQNYEPYRGSRNPYFERIREIEVEHPRAPTILMDHNTEQFKGRWREDFFKADSSAKLQLEIGSYHGETLIQQASRSEDLYLGIEWKYKTVFKAGEKAIAAGLGNLAFMRANAARIKHMFAPGELDRVWILFPDPWPKEAQKKWRLLHKDFFSLLAEIMDVGKELMIKTDHHEYALFIKEQLDLCEAYDAMEFEDSDPIWSSFPLTTFETIFLKQNLPTYSFALKRNHNPSSRFATSLLQ